MLLFVMDFMKLVVVGNKTGNNLQLGINSYNNIDNVQE